MATDTWRERIIADPAVLVGKPVIQGTRLAVELILELLASGWTPDQILANYTGITAEDIRACIAYAKEVLQEERVLVRASQETSLGFLADEPDIYDDSDGEPV